jgi:hypothetical protein
MFKSAFNRTDLFDNQHFIHGINRIIPFCFWLLPFCYAWCYAPYGMNETDGGFITGLAWQVVQGKTLYADLIYVRPPLPVWLRAVELQLLPEQWAILGERWVFYFKMALVSWLGMIVLRPKNWSNIHATVLASCAFVVSVHCYPAAAWHTVDGILFAVLGAYSYFVGKQGWQWILSGACIAAAMLCKQSFYPVAGLFFLFYWTENRRRYYLTLAGWIGVITLFVSYLAWNDLLNNFIALTNGATSGGQALEHGIVDYFRIHPLLVMSTVVLLVVLTRKCAIIFKEWAIAGWLVVLIGSYAWSVWQRQAYTVPFSQSRLLFLLACAYTIWIWLEQRRLPDRWIALLLISWCASVSWGYNTPVLCSLPLIAGVFFGLEKLIGDGKDRLAAVFLLLIVLLGLFRFSYTFVYRDAPRPQLTADLGVVFPALQGIYSTPEKLVLYTELRRLQQHYGPNFVVLPVFTQAHFLTQTTAPVGIDWIAQREMGETGKALLMKEIAAKKPVFFIEKKWLSAIEQDTELRFVRSLLEQGRVVEETTFFQVLVLP